jgi:hypothetical protein
MKQRPDLAQLRLLTDLLPSAALGDAGNATRGVPTLNDGTHSASITMIGNFSQSSFVIGSDGHHGSLVTFT